MWFRTEKTLWELGETDRLESGLKRAESPKARVCISIAAGVLPRVQAGIGHRLSSSSVMFEAMLRARGTVDAGTLILRSISALDSAPIACQDEMSPCSFCSLERTEFALRRFHSQTHDHVTG